MTKVSESTIPRRSNRLMRPEGLILRKNPSGDWEAVNTGRNAPLPDTINLRMLAIAWDVLRLNEVVAK